MKEEEILQYVKEHPDQKVKLAITDIDGILRGKYISTEKFLGAIKGNLGFCNVVFGWDANDVAYDNTQYTGWHTAYPDAPAKVDLSTFRKIPWENDIPFFLCELVHEKENPADVCPRNLLKKIIAQADKAGYVPYFSQEFEWFNFEETPQSSAEKKFNGLSPLSPGMFGYSILRSTLRNDFFSAIFDELRKFDIPLEGLHTE